MNENQGFFKSHADTITIIGVNIAIAAILFSMWVSQSSRIDCCNSRMDNAFNAIVEMQKEIKQIYIDRK